MSETKITSKDNLKIKHLRKLNSKKYREEFGEFLVENFTILKDAVIAGYKPTSVFVTSNFAEKNEVELNEVMKKTNLPYYFEINTQINKAFSKLDNPSGIAAVYPTASSPKEVNTKQSVVYLNGVSNPGNLGTIMRSALAFGVKSMVLDETCADPYNFKTINASKDAIFKIKISYDEDIKLLKKIKKDMPILSTQMKASKEVGELSDIKKACVVLGDESKGISSEVQKLSTEIIRIKISDDIESLNVAASAAIIFHHLYINK
jgi:TrmH family RNA methyltransferase